MKSIHPLRAALRVKEEKALTNIEHGEPRSVAGSHTISSSYTNDKWARDRKRALGGLIRGSEKALGDHSGVSAMFVKGGVRANDRDDG